MCVWSNAELSSLSLIVSRTKDPQRFFINRQNLEKLSIVKIEDSDRNLRTFLKMLHESPFSSIRILLYTKVTKDLLIIVL